MAESDFSSRPVVVPAAVASAAPPDEAEGAAAAGAADGMKELSWLQNMLGLGDLGEGDRFLNRRCRSEEEREVEEADTALAGVPLREEPAR